MMTISKKWRTAAVVFLTSAMIPAFNLPADYDTARGADEERVEGYVKQRLVFTGTSGTSKWHFLTNFPDFHYMVFRDTRTGALHKVFTNDTIVVKFSNGSKVLLAHKGPFAPSTGFFQWAHGTERRPDGAPYNHDGSHECKEKGGCRAGGGSIPYVYSLTKVMYSYVWGASIPEMEGW